MDGVSAHVKIVAKIVFRHHRRICHLERGRMPESKDPYPIASAGRRKGVSSDEFPGAARNGNTTQGSFDFADRFTRRSVHVAQDHIRTVSKRGSRMTFAKCRHC